MAAPVSAAPRPSAGCTQPGVAAGDRLEQTIDVGGVARKYILHVPDSVKTGQAVPLLLDFHGWGHSAAGVWTVSRFKELAERDAFITAYPDGLPVTLLRGEARPGWEIARVDGNRDLAFVTALLDHLEREYCIDRARIYSTGFSNGAFFSHILGCTMADRIAAIAPVGGGQITVACEPTRPMPVLIYHGLTDELIPPERARRARDQWLALDQCGEPQKGKCERHTACSGGVEVRYCEVDLGHTWPPEATAEIWEFLRSYSLPERKL
jgi:polyhydroxybutyrate depolymerase